MATTQPIEDDADEYKMDNRNGGLLYVINNGIVGIEENLEGLKKSFKEIGYRSPPKLRKVIRARELERLIERGNYESYDCVSLVVVSREEALPDQEYAYIKAFFSDVNEQLNCKPRMLFFIYEKKLTFCGEDEHDSTNEYEIPIQADFFVVQMTVIDIKKALDRLSNVLKTIDNKKWYVYEKMNNLKEDMIGSMTFMSTLTRRFYITKKITTRQDRNRTFIMKRNELLKVLISQLQYVELDEKISEFYENNNLDEIEKRITADRYEDLPDREDLIVKLNRFMLECAACDK